MLNNLRRCLLLSAVFQLGMHCLPVHAWTDCPVGNRQYQIIDDVDPLESTEFYEIRKGPLTDDEKFNYQMTVRNFWNQTREYARNRGTILYTVKCDLYHDLKKNKVKRVCEDSSGQPISFKNVHCNVNTDNCPDIDTPNFKDKNGIPGNYHAGWHHPYHAVACDAKMHFNLNIGHLYYFTTAKHEMVYTGKFLYHIKVDRIRVREKLNFSGF